MPSLFGIIPNKYPLRGCYQNSNESFFSTNNNTVDAIIVILLENGYFVYDLHCSKIIPSFDYI